MKSMQVKVEKGKPKQLRQIVKGKVNAYKDIYTYARGKFFFKKTELQGGYSLNTSCPSTTHLASLNRERSTSGCTQEN